MVSLGLREPKAETINQHPVLNGFLVHLPLTFSGLVCILSLKGRQEQCPFTTRLRGLKLDVGPEHMHDDEQKVQDDHSGSPHTCHPFGWYQQQ